MGIKGLTSFMQQNPDITQPFKLHNTTVIFDGKNLIHMLYKKYEVDYRYGGEYERYYDCARMYMSSFLECNIKPIVVMDGAREKSERKLKSSIESFEEKIKRAHYIANGKLCSHPIFPLLVGNVFQSVLSDLGILFANCDYAADDQVVALGNYYKCPIISNDSDFYIFDSHQGFIQLDSIDTKINLDIGSDGKEYKFLSCKIYNIDEFVQAFPGLDKNILPLFGTLFGTTFVEAETFDVFFANFNPPKYEHGRLSLDLSRVRDKTMVGVLCWLQHKTLNKAVDDVISYFEKNEQEHIKSVIDISVGGYKLNPCSLTFIFDTNIDDPRNDLLSNSMLITPCGNRLPRNLILKFHHVKLSSFAINVIGLHRVFLKLKIEDMKQKSSNSCSSYIRQILYGILVRHDSNGSECRNEECLRPIEEYDRHGSSIGKQKVQPLFTLDGIGLLPTVDEVCCISKEQCIAIISKTLGISFEFFLHIPNSWQLYIGCLNYWLRISGCRSEAFISAVILNLIYFGLIKCKDPSLNQKRCPKTMPSSNKCTCSSITCMAANVTDSDLKYAGKRLEEYCINPTWDKRLFLNIAHSFSQIKSCLIHITILNELLNDVFENFAPHKCFSGIMLYNLTDAIVSCPIDKFFIGKILGNDLSLLFTQLKSKVCENVPCFVSRSTEPKYTIVKGKQKLSQRGFK